MIIQAYHLVIILSEPYTCLCSYDVYYVHLIYFLIKISRKSNNATWKQLLPSS